MTYRWLRGWPLFHDKKAFDALVVKYQAAVRRFFLSQTLGDAQLSDDLAQDTFIKAYTNIGRFRGLSGFFHVALSHSLQCAL